MPAAVNRVAVKLALHIAQKVEFRRRFFGGGYNDFTRKTVGYRLREVLSGNG